MIIVQLSMTSSIAFLFRNKFLLMKIMLKSRVANLMNNIKNIKNYFKIHWIKLKLKNLTIQQCFNGLDLNLVFKMFYTFWTKTSCVIQERRPAKNFWNLMKLKEILNIKCNWKIITPKLGFAYRWKLWYLQTKLWQCSKRWFYVLRWYPLRNLCYLSGFQFNFAKSNFYSSIMKSWWGYFKSSNKVTLQPIWPKTNAWQYGPQNPRG